MACLRSLPENFSRSLLGGFPLQQSSAARAPARQSGYRVEQIMAAGEWNVVLGTPRREVLLRLGQVLTPPLQLKHMHEPAGPIRSSRREQEEVRPSRLQNPLPAVFAAVHLSRLSPAGKWVHRQSCRA
jgi:hypothetical protein